MSNQNPLTLSLTLTDHARCLSVKREIKDFNPNDPGDPLAIHVTRTVDEMAGLLAIAQNAIGHVAPVVIKERETKPTHCWRCGAETKGTGVRISPTQTECWACANPTQCCPICGKVTKGYAAGMARSGFELRGEVCHCKDPEDKSIVLGMGNCVIPEDIIKRFPTPRP